MLRKEQLAQLEKPFAIDAHSFRVLQRAKDGKTGKWYSYIDARDVQDRLSQVDPGWHSEYKVVHLNEESCAVECTLTLCGAVRSDIGTDYRNTNRAGEFTDNEGNYIKGAYSDALKRCAVNFGVGRYLYRMPSYYAPIDQYGQFTDEGMKKIKETMVRHLAQMSKGQSVAHQAAAVQSTAPAPDMHPDDVQLWEDRQPDGPPVQEPQPAAGKSKKGKTEDDDKQKQWDLGSFHGIGQIVYSSDWESKRPVLVKSVTKGSDSSADLTREQIGKLSLGMTKKWLEEVKYPAGELSALVQSVSNGFTKELDKLFVSGLYKVVKQIAEESQQEPAIDVSNADEMPF